MKKRIHITNKFDIERFTRWLKEDFTLDQLVRITQNQYSKNSLLAIRKDWLQFVEYCCTQGHNPLPASPQSVKLFITSMSRNRKYSSLKRYVVTISNIHQILGYPDPAGTNEVQLLLQQHKLDKLGDERSTVAFTKQHLDLLVSKLENQKDPMSIRDLAIYSVMFECALKRGELRDLVFSQLNQKINVEYAHTEILLQDNKYQLSEMTSLYLARWTSLLGSQTGAVFRAIDKHQNISQNNLNDSSIFRIFQKAASLLGLPEHQRFSGQSARVGAVQELYRQGYKVRDIQEFGRWNSPVMPNYYLGNNHQAELGKVIYKSFKHLL